MPFHGHADHAPQEELLPTPAKSHYTFNLRDLSKVFQGTLMVAPSSCPSRDVLLRLWVHESCRVFHDRCVPAMLFPATCICWVWERWEALDSVYGGVGRSVGAKHVTR